MLKIVSVPNSVLTSPAQNVAIIDEKIKKLVYDMEETLIAQVDPQGVGLAAPQVGESLQLFIIKPSAKSPSEVFINPKILEIVSLNPDLKTTSKNKKNKLEGCLSIPRIWSPVKRPNKVRLEYQDLTGKKKTLWFTGLKSIIVQHEVDHLQGVLFTQRALEQGTQLFEEKDGEFVKITNI